MAETLRALVLRLADERTQENFDAFWQALLKGQVAVPMDTLPADLQSGAGISNEHCRVPSTRLRDGSVMLLVYADRQAAMLSPGAKACFEMSGRVVLEMAAAKQLGVMVTTGPGAAAWPAVPPENVSAVLSWGNRHKAGGRSG